MSADMLRDLEGKIGVLPWTDLKPDPLKVADVRQWLLLKGLNKGKLDNMRPDSLLKCYAFRPYYAKVNSDDSGYQSPRKNHRLSASMLEDEDDAVDLSQPIGTYGHAPAPAGTPDFSKVPGLQVPVQGLDGDIVRSELNALKSKLERDIQLGLASSSVSIVDMVERDLVKKFNDGEIKVEFSAKSKAEIRDLVTKTSADFLAQNLPPREIIVKVPEKDLSINVGTAHHAFPDLLTALSCGLHVMLVGAASSSKTTSSKMAIEALGRKFRHMGAAASEFKYAGFEDGHGKYHTTPFRESYEFGGGILLDEYDAGSPAAPMFAQAALSNGTCQFPDRIVEQHPEFLCIAACNTFGRGADRQYVSRNQQDAAALDRFVVIDWDIDEDLEAQLFGDGRKYWDASQPAPAPQVPFATMSPGDWVRRVQKIRAAIYSMGESVRHLVTMRASDFGGRLLQAGMSLDKVEQMCVWKGLNPATIDKIKHAAHI